MKISGREKNIIVVVLAIAIVFCAYWFGFRNLTAENEALDKEISTMQGTLNNLRMIESEVPQYEEDTVTLTALNEETLKEYDTGYSQEHSIMFVKEIENTVDAWVGQLGIGENNVIYNFGQAGSSNPYLDTGLPEYTSDYQGVQTSLTMSYQTTYEDFKNLIEFVNTYKYKCTIDTMSMTYNPATDMVSGSLVVSQYAITGLDREFDNESFANYLYGTSNIFYSDIYHGDGSNANLNGENILADYDYFVRVDYIDSDQSLSIGAKTDATGQNTLVASGNDNHDCEIRFFKDGEDYFVQYSIGKDTFPATEYEKGSYFIPGDELNLLITSTERGDKNDKLAARVSLINETDMILNVKIHGDDSGNPRVVIADTKGDVVVYR